MKNKMIILLASLIAVIICLVFYNKSKRIVAPETGEKTIGDKPIAETMFAEHSVAPSPEKGFVLPDGVDPELVDREIIDSGYRPSTEQEWTKLRKSVSVDYYGAKTRLTFHVTDSEGGNVPDATVTALFSTDKEVKVVGDTDKGGIFVAEGRSSYSLNYVVNKDGHYETRAVHSFSARNGFDVVNDRWVPWNPTIAVTLKEKRNPIPMYYDSRCTIYVPKGETVGFDCMVGDLVAPHGKGATADFLFTYTAERNGNTLSYVTNEFIVAIQDGGGFYAKKKDMDSCFQFEYTAPLEGYEEEVFYEFARTLDKIFKDTTLPKDEYLIFRSRTETDGGDNITRAHHGIIASLQYGETRKNASQGVVILQYYFNPTPNDRNLEYGNNLFDERRGR